MRSKSQFIPRSFLLLSLVFCCFFFQKVVAQSSSAKACKDLFESSIFRQVRTPFSHLIQGQVLQSLVWRGHPAFLVESSQVLNQYTLVSAERPDYPLLEIPAWEDRPARAVGGSTDQLKLTENRLEWSRRWTFFEPNQALYTHKEYKRYYRISFDNVFDLFGRRESSVKSPSFEEQTQPQKPVSSDLDLKKEFPQDLSVRGVLEESEQFLLGFPENPSEVWILERSSKSLLKIPVERKFQLKQEFMDNSYYGNMGFKDFSKIIVLPNKVISLEVLVGKVVVQTAIWNTDLKVWSPIEKHILKTPRGQVLLAPFWDQGYGMYQPMETEMPGKSVVLLKDMSKKIIYSFLEINSQSGVISISEKFAVPRDFVPRLLRFLPDSGEKKSSVLSLFDQHSRTLIFPDVFP